MLLSKKALGFVMHCSSASRGSPFLFSENDKPRKALEYMHSLGFLVGQKIIFHFVYTAQSVASFLSNRLPGTSIKK